MIRNGGSPRSIKYPRGPRIEVGCGQRHAGRSSIAAQVPTRLLVAASGKVFKFFIFPETHSTWNEGLARGGEAVLLVNAQNEWESNIFLNQIKRM